MLLSLDQIRKLHTAAIEANLVYQRATLLSAVNKRFVAMLQTNPSPIAQLLMDLNQMNDDPQLTDGSVPLEAWLEQAVTLTTGRPQEAQFQDALAQLRSGRGRASPGRSARPVPPPRSHFLDESPFDFDRPEGRSLWSLLHRSLDRAADVRGALDRAEISMSRVDLEQPSRARWRDALAAAANQGRAQRLVEGIAADPEHAALRGRLEELLREEPPAEVGPGRIEWRGREPTRGYERLTSQKSRLVDVAFLAKGLDRARSVVRINASFGGESLTGTGFFIAPGRVLTNHHVLFHDGKPASRVALWIDYEIRPDGSLPHPGEVMIVAPKIQGEAEHDWATLEVPDEKARSVPALSLRAAKPVAVGEYVSIIQHPHGLPKKLGIFGSEVRFVGHDEIQYLTDTEEGSSGSPVFDRRWEVVALHHSWTTADLANGEQEIRNEGVRIERVIEALRRRSLIV